MYLVVCREYVFSFITDNFPSGHFKYIALLVHWSIVIQAAEFTLHPNVQRPLKVSSIYIQEN